MLLAVAHPLLQDVLDFAELVPGGGQQGASGKDESNNILPLPRGMGVGSASGPNHPVTSCLVSDDTPMTRPPLG